MRIIAHRGNLNGPVAEKENNPDYIKNAIKAGYEAEIDIWFLKNKFFLGHDNPQYEITEKFFDDNMWIHCKNLNAVEALKKTNLNWFWHQEDKLTITSLGYIWCFPNVYIDDGITVNLGKKTTINKNILGICTDYPENWRR
jgi:hypothetical protein